jgi:hypothetical protein
MTSQQLLATKKTFQAKPVTLEQYFRFLNGDPYECLALGIHSREDKMRHIAETWGITKRDALRAYVAAGWV